LHRLGRRLDPLVVLRHLLRPRVVGPQRLEQRQRRHAADRELLGAIEKVAPRDVSMLVLMEEVQQFLRVIRRLLALHRTAPLLERTRSREYTAPHRQSMRTMRSVTCGKRSKTAGSWPGMTSAGVLARLFMRSCVRRLDAASS